MADFPQSADGNLTEKLQQNWRTLGASSEHKNSQKKPQSAPLLPEKQTTGQIK